jgi:GntR family transcriptional regulator
MSGLAYVDLVIDFHDGPEPAYQRLAEFLRARIMEGEWRTGPLPSVKFLQQEYGLGRDTVLRAIGILREEGLVETVARRGTYVKRKATGQE